MLGQVGKRQQTATESTTCRGQRARTSSSSELEPAAFNTFVSARFEWLRPSPVPIASARAVPLAKPARQQSDLVRLLKGNRDFAGRHSGRWAPRQRELCMPMGTRVVWSPSLPLAVATLLARAATSSLRRTAQSPGRWKPCAFRRSDTCNLWGEGGIVGLLGHGTCQKGGGTELFSEQSGCTCHCGYWFKCAEYSETSPVTPLFDAGDSPSSVVPQPLRKVAAFLRVKSVRTEGQLAQSRHMAFLPCSR